MKTQAKILASGDRVIFPLIGAKTILRMTGVSRLNISFVFDDQKLRSFRLDRLVEAELLNRPLIPLPGEIVRLDFETGRASVISPSLFGFSTEVSKSFSALRGRVSSFSDIAALAEIQKGATLFTAEAIYSIPVPSADSETRRNAA